MNGQDIPSYNDYFHELFPNAVMAGMKRVGFLHEFKARGIRVPTTIQVDIFYFGQENTHALVILTDLDNGTSVTNASEQIATEVRRKYNLHPDKTLWAEVYLSEIQSRNGNLDGWMESNLFDQISYTYSKDDDEFRNPSWSTINTEALPITKN